MAMNFPGPQQPWPPHFAPHAQQQPRPVQTEGPGTGHFGKGSFTMKIEQQPLEALQAVDSRPKNRKPVDPPPIVKLTVNSNADPQQIFMHSPNLFMIVTLLDPNDDNKDVGNVLLGSLTSSLHRLKNTDNKGSGPYGAYFVFGDISVKELGEYRLKFHLFDIVKKENAANWLGEIVSSKFRVVSNKDWRGLANSTFLSRAFSDQGVRLRLRKEPSSNHKRNYQEIESRPAPHPNIVPNQGNTQYSNPGTAMAPEMTPVSEADDAYNNSKRRRYNNDEWGGRLSETSFNPSVREESDVPRMQSYPPPQYPPQLEENNVLPTPMPDVHSQQASQPQLPPLQMSPVGPPNFQHGYMNSHQDHHMMQQQPSHNRQDSHMPMQNDHNRSGLPLIHGQQGQHRHDTQDLQMRYGDGDMQRHPQGSQQGSSHNLPMMQFGSDRNAHPFDFERFAPPMPPNYSNNQFSGANNAVPNAFAADNNPLPGNSNLSGIGMNNLPMPNLPNEPLDFGFGATVPIDPQFGNRGMLPDIGGGGNNRDQRMGMLPDVNNMMPSLNRPFMPNNGENMPHGGGR